MKLNMTHDCNVSSPVIVILPHKYGPMRVFLCILRQGKLQTAMEYLRMVPGEAGDAVAVLQDRIYRSSAAAGSTMQAPPFPFAVETISEAPIAPPGASSSPPLFLPLLELNVLVVSLGEKVIRKGSFDRPYCDHHGCKSFLSQ